MWEKYLEIVEQSQVFLPHMIDSKIQQGYDSQVGPSAMSLGGTS